MLVVALAISMKVGADEVGSAFIWLMLPAGDKTSINIAMLYFECDKFIFNAEITLTKKLRLESILQLSTEKFEKSYVYNSCYFCF